MNRNYAILGTARSGTTLLYRIIKDLSIDFDSRLKDEFFQTDLQGFTVFDSGSGLYQSDAHFENKNSEIQRRLKLLEKYNYKYTIKCVPHQLTFDIIQCLITNYNIIFCERRDRFDRYLSFLIASKSRVFNSATPIKRNNKIMIEDALIESFFEIDAQWEVNKKNILEHTTCKVIYYEDLVSNPEHEIKTKTMLNWTDCRTEHYQHLVKLNSQKEKENLIENLDYVITRFNHYQNNHESPE